VTARGQKAWFLPASSRASSTDLREPAAAVMALCPQ
jgi:hypothetical protein